MSQMTDPFHDRIDDLEKELHEEWMLRTFAEAKLLEARALLKQCLYAGVSDRFFLGKIQEFLQKESK